MTAGAPALASARPGPGEHAVVRASLRTLWLLRLELRHNAMAWLAPVAIGLFWLTTYRKVMAMPPLWNVRAAGLQSGAVPDFVIPVTAAAAWMGSREARRRVADQVSITARARWARLLVSWAATSIWAGLAYLACVAVLYGATARQASWGGPLWWPAVVAAASLPAFAAFGFIAGTFLPSRFTAPLASIIAFFILALSTELISGSQSPWQVAPLVAGPWDMGPQLGVATFYPFLPDLSIAQVMFLAGLTVALLGVLALPARAGSGAARKAAAAITGAGVLAAGTAAWLTGTGTLDAHGMIKIPALHDAASDRPLPFTPLCGGTAIPVCLNPAYASYLPATETALGPLLSQVAGLPGAPSRVVQVDVTYHQESGNGITLRAAGRRDERMPRVIYFVLPSQLPGPPLTTAQLAGQLVATNGPRIIRWIIGSPATASDARNAVAAGLMLAVGQGALTPERASRDAGSSPVLAPGTPAYAAAERFAALPAAARRAWLVRRLAALRAGQVTLEQVP